MRNLILVKHSLPQIEQHIPASQWHLSDEGRARCKPLADSLSRYLPDAIISSREPKAAETGEIVADLLEKPLRIAEGLHEHDRSNVGWLDSTEAFELSVARFFDKPDSLVFGLETADQAYQRFSSAVDVLLDDFQSGNVVVVAHGTVITLFVARAAGLAPFPLWKRLGLPSFVALSVPGYEMLEVVERVRL